MLKITIPSVELYDETKGEFIYTKEQTLQLEHSLVSLSKWESKWEKVFLSKEEKTFEESIDYIRCMTITQNVDSSVYNYLTDENIRQVDAYISASMTATYIHEDKTVRGSREPVTAEIIYYWMIVNGIPFECQKWHLNRLLMLIRVCSIKSQPQKKRSQKEILRQYAAINEARKKRLNTTG